MRLVIGKFMCSRRGWMTAFMMVALTLALASGVAAGEKAAAGEQIQVGSTTENLLTAYRAELSSAARYRECATKAAEEGYHQVAVMFRAIARGEEIHALRLGALAGVDQSKLEGALDVEPPRSTLENVAAALANQRSEQESMYPQFIKQAKRDKNREAVRLFEEILETEPTHRAWYQQILASPDSYTASGAQFHVCPSCGAVSRAGKKSCPCCSEPGDKFEKVL